jgi:hypothetical protein
MRRRISVLAVLAALAALPAAATPVSVAVAKTCGSGYKHAVVPGGAHKCLRAGQFCSRKQSYQRVYKSKGYICPPSGHLRRR